MRLKDLMREAQFIERFIAQNRDAKEAHRFREVMEYFTDEMRLFLFEKRRLHEEFGETSEEYKDAVKKLLDADLKEFAPIPVTGTISIDVLIALTRLGVVSG